MRADAEVRGGLEGVFDAAFDAARGGGGGGGGGVARAARAQPCAAAEEALDPKWLARGVRRSATPAALLLGPFARWSPSHVASTQRCAVWSAGRVTSRRVHADERSSARTANGGDAM